MSYSFPDACFSLFLTDLVLKEQVLIFSVVILILFSFNRCWCLHQNIRCTNKFPTFFIKNWAFIVKERNLMFYSKNCPSYCSCCVWHESWSNNASNSTSSYTFDLPLRSLSSMSNSPFLNFWNHSRQLLSLKAASPCVSTSNRCASAADFFKLKK